MKARPLKLILPGRSPQYPTLPGQATRQIHSLPISLTLFVNIRRSSLTQRQAGQKLDATLENIGHPRELAQLLFVGTLDSITRLPRAQWAVIGCPGQDGADFAGCVVAYGEDKIRSPAHRRCREYAPVLAVEPVS